MKNLPAKLTALKNRLVAGWLGVSRQRGFKISAIVLTVAAAVLLAAHPTFAAGDFIKDATITIIGWVAQVVVTFFGWIIITIIPSLIAIASYNNFVTAPAVGVGWVLVRDICNMFFVLILLVLAFGTILGADSYSIKGGNLTRLLIMAILINFSRTICGLLIDLSQVITLTFVSGFKEAAAGNFISALKIDQVLQSAASQSEAADFIAVVTSLILAMVMTGIALFVIIMITVAFVVRIVYLWLLVVLSPAAFFLRAVPGGAGKFSDWWNRFVSQLVGGPVLAFFLWLSLVSVQQGDIAGGLTVQGTGESFGSVVSATFDSQALAQYIIAVGLLLTGLMIAKQVGGESMAVGSQAATYVKGQAQRAASWAGRKGWEATKATGGVLADNIKIRGGKEVFNEKTGQWEKERVSLRAYAKTGYEKGKKAVVTSGVGRAVGLDKEHTERRRTEEQIKAYEGRGMTVQANQLKKEAYGKEVEHLKKMGITRESLYQEYERESAANPGSIRQKALTIMMAGEGRFNGQYGKMKDLSGNDLTMLAMMKAASKDKGDELAEIDQTQSDEGVQKQIADMLIGSDKSKRARLMTQFANGVAVGADNKPKNELATKGLAAIDGSMFRAQDKQLQERLLGALEIAVKTGQMTQAEADKRASGWGTTRLTGAKAQEAVDKMDRGRLTDMGLLLGSGRLNRAFTSYDEATATFKDDEERDLYERFVAAKEGNGRMIIQNTKADALVENGGVNDLAIGAFSNIKVGGTDKDGKALPNEILEMVKGKNGAVSPDNVFATLQAARGLANAGDTELQGVVDKRWDVIEKRFTDLLDADIEREVEEYRKKFPNATDDDLQIVRDTHVTSGAYQNLFTAERQKADQQKQVVQQRVFAARQNARDIVDSQDNGTLGMVTKGLTYKAKAFREAKSVGGTVLKGAALTYAAPAVAAAAVAAPVTAAVVAGAALIGKSLKDKVTKEMTRQADVAAKEAEKVKKAGGTPEPPKTGLSAVASAVGAVVAPGGAGRTISRTGRRARRFVSKI
ncbi:MAG: hypothetical protein PHT12_04220 [Patescibacteria group bacterium]|nr:hypothetical protein [Patescibacteria group bacterium]